MLKRSKFNTEDPPLTGLYHNVEFDSMIKQRKMDSFFPYSWNVIEAIAITIVCSLVCTILIFFPEISIKLLSKLSIRTTEDLSQRVPIFVRDLLLIWGIGIIFVCLDSASRYIQGTSLLNKLFFKTYNQDYGHDCQIIMMTFWVTVFLVPALIVINIMHSKFDLTWLTGEDGPLEYATVINFVMAAALLFYTCFKRFERFRPRDYRNVSILAGLGGMLMVVALEEISWGQRIIGFKTPESLTEINTQGEFNFHNLMTTELLNSYLFISAFLFLLTAISFIIMIKRYRLGRYHWILLYLPHPSLIVIFSVMAVISLHIGLNDLVEQLASLVVVLYGWRLAILLCRDSER